MRYYGSMHGLYGDTPEQQYLCDWALDTFNDLWGTAFYQEYFKESTEETKMKKDGESFASFCHQLEKRLSSMDAKPFLTGSKMTIGDIKCYCPFANLVFNDNVTNKGMAAHLKEITARYPQVSAWIKVMDARFATYFAAHPKKNL